MISDVSKEDTQKKRSEMTQSTAPESTPAAGKSLPARLIGIVFSPKEAYADVAARPRWLGALLVVFVLVGGPTFAFMSTEVGRNALLDQQVKTMESFGIKMKGATRLFFKEHLPVDLVHNDVCS